MTPEEARALFPVLERLAYLNAGTFGPLARPTAEAVRAQLDVDSRRAASARRTSSGCSSCAAGARAALAGARRRRRRSTSRSRARRRTAATSCSPGSASARGRDRDDDARALRPARAGARERRARRRGRRPTPEAILAAVTPRTRLLAVSHVLWTTRPRAPRAGAAGADGRAGARRRRAVGRRDPGRRGGLDFYTVSGQKWLCGPDCDGRALRRRPGVAPRRPAELLLAGRLRARRQLRAGAGAARFDPGWIATAGLAGLAGRARRCRRSGASSARAELAARCRELLGAARRRRRRAMRRSSRSARRIRRSWSRSSLRRGRRRPRPPGRASCAPRAASGRTRTTSSGSSRRS